jgi:hypothetical protein
MEIETLNAAGVFFPNPAFPQVYFEAVANALDAGATKVSIAIEIKSFGDADTLRVRVTDNGTGFTDENFGRFERLLKPRDGSHKGLGRLIYLRYFRDVDVASRFGDVLRTFIFSERFKGEKTDSEAPMMTDNQTCLTFKNFGGKQLKSYDDLRPKAVKEYLTLELLPRFYELKDRGSSLTIEITLHTELGNADRDFMNDTQTFTLAELPKVTEVEIQCPELDLFDTIKMAYVIETGFAKSTVLTAVNVDGRSIDLKLIPPGGIPANHTVIFLFYSDYLNGKADSSRQRLNLDDAEEKSLRRVLRKHVAATVSQMIPAVEKKNEVTKKHFADRFPHLLGYFEEETVGLINSDEALEIAQRRFFMEQKEILEADRLDNAQFERSLEVSSRTLTEYILYRNIIIQKLREINSENAEADIHSLIAPRYRTFRGSEFMRGIYSNNAWLLDDKFMTFSTILSEADMDKLIREITLADDVAKDDSRPDISMIFSADPTAGGKVDVVIVELKKRTGDEKENINAITQLLQRAEKLVTSCPNIQRIWYYALMQISESLGRRLTQLKWSPLFSKGQVYYQEFLTPNPDGRQIPTPTFVLSFDAVINDAEDRNSTFLKILREAMQQASEVRRVQDAVMVGRPESSVRFDTTVAATGVQNEL